MYLLGCSLARSVLDSRSPDGMHQIILCSWCRVLVLRADPPLLSRPGAATGTLTESEARRPGQVPRARNGYYDSAKDKFSKGRRRDFARGQLHLFRVQGCQFCESCLNMILCSQLPTREGYVQTVNQLFRQCQFCSCPRAIGQIHLSSSTGSLGMQFLKVLIMPSSIPESNPTLNSSF